jgi:hypothetical protein
MAPSTFAPNRRGRLVLLNLFSGPYARSNGLATKLRALGWQVIEIDNDGEKGGGWGHDLLNDANFHRLLVAAAAGAFDALMIAFPCSTFSIARFFDATNGDGGDRGPPVIRTATHPDGLPDDQIDPKHIKELKLSNEVIRRACDIAIAARRSASRATIVIENPAGRSPGESIASSDEFKDHGSLFRTSHYKRLEAGAELTGKCTFA